MLSNQAIDSSKSREQSEDALMVLFVERCFVEHSFVDSAIYSQIFDDCID